MSAPDELVDRIRNILVERLFLELPAGEPAADESLTEKHGVDSVRLFDLVVGLEDDFDIRFDDAELALKNFDTVNAIAARVHAKMNGG